MYLGVLIFEMGFYYIETAYCKTTPLFIACSSAKLQSSSAIWLLDRHALSYYFKVL